MPELPEVETIKNGLLPYCKNTIIRKTTIRQPKLRWPIPCDLDSFIKNEKIVDIKRRSKYLLFYTNSGVLVIHLGMSGNLRVIDKKLEPKKHDHVDIQLSNNKILRYHDPRRFGAILWVDNIDNINQHKLFKHLGPEPLTDEFNLEYIIAKAKNKKTPAKNFIMNNINVVGVGNIYATEALFYAKINPFKPVGEIKPKQWQELIYQIKKILKKAIECGGTTLKDFTNSDGKPGYFKQELAVYGRSNQACINCSTILKSQKQQGRTTVYCPKCQQ